MGEQNGFIKQTNKQKKNTEELMQQLAGMTSSYRYQWSMLCEKEQTDYQERFL